MVLDEGVWEAPTPSVALRVLVANQDMYSRNPAVAVLRQTFEVRSNAELQAFTDQLTALMIEGDEEASNEAWNTLSWISWSRGGIEHIRAVFNAADVPPHCRPHAPPQPGEEDPCLPRSEWCSAGLHLLGTSYAPDEDEYDSRCVRKW